MKEYSIDIYNKLLRSISTISIKEIENSGDFFREYGAFIYSSAIDSTCLIFDNRLFIHTQHYNNPAVLHATFIDAINNELKMGVPAYKYNYDDELKLDDSTLNYFLMFRFFRGEAFLSEKYSYELLRNWDKYTKNKPYNAAYLPKIEKINNYCNVLRNLDLKYELKSGI